MDLISKIQFPQLQNAGRREISLALAAGAVIASTAALYNTEPLPFFISKHKRNAGYLLHPSEVLALFKFKFCHTLPSVPQDVPEVNKWCFEKLFQTSRSFAAVIMALTEELREPVCVFYLVLRALDTVEDDMKPSVKSKVKQLIHFHEHLSEPGWNLTGFGDKPSVIDLLEKFDKVIAVFSGLKPKYQEVIADICARMGKGMAECLEMDAGVEKIEDYELYCHYVAGLVGHGLSRLFACSKIENEKLATSLDLANSMGLFLQKTNIIRDFLEDILEEPPRIWYPKQIWSLYTDDICDLKEAQNYKSALQCLNHMIADALKHAPDCLKYMRMIQNATVFRFFGIPQVMAMATLDVCYNNYDVFRSSEVKIRKGLAVQLILECTNYEKVCALFKRFVNSLRSKVPAEDPSAKRMHEQLDILEAALP